MTEAQAWLLLAILVAHALIMLSLMIWISDIRLDTRSLRMMAEEALALYKLTKTSWYGGAIGKTNDKSN